MLSAGVRIFAGALLASATLATASGSASVPGLELVSGSVSKPLAGLELQCPAGKEVVGIGGSIVDGDSGEMKLVTLWPSSFFSADPLPGREVRRLVVAHPASNPSSEAFGRVGCTPGKKVVGMGARLSDVRGQVALTTLTTIDEHNEQVIAQAVEDQDGFAGDWTLEVAAICADPLPGYAVVHTRSAIDSADKALSARCPDGTVALAVGARTEVDGIDQAGNGEVVLNDLVHRPALDGVRVTALEDQDGFVRAWQLKTTAICAAA